MPVCENLYDENVSFLCFCTVERKSSLYIYKQLSANHSKANRCPIHIQIQVKVQSDFIFHFFRLLRKEMFDVSNESEQLDKHTFQIANICDKPNNM